MLNIKPKIGIVPADVAGKLSGIEFLRSLQSGDNPAPPYNETADVWPVSFEVGKVVFEGKPSKRFYNPMGIVHGGWLAGLLDTVMACAVQSTLDAGYMYTTIELKTVFVKAVTEKTGPMRAEGSILHAGRRVAHADGKLFDAAGKLLAYGSEACLIMPAQPPGT
jgi:uncharacterized protein (TIGR00369 family)